VVGLREAKRGLPIGLDGVFMGVSEDKVFGLGAEAVRGGCGSGEGGKIEGCGLDDLF